MERREKMKPSRVLFLGLVLIGSIVGLWLGRTWGQGTPTLTTPVYMQDTPSDTGIEPNPDNGVM
jgi:hypothetical protein